MRTACGRELIFQNVHRAQARARFCRPKMVLITSQVRKMSTPLKREHHSQQKCAPRAGESAAARPRCAGRGRCRQKNITNCSLETYVRRTPPRRESHESPSLVNSTRIAPACGVGTRATAGGLMPATRGRAQRNEFNLHLDSAGHGFGATHGGSRRRILGVWEKCGNVARK
jgi:hypothetical protein